MTALLSPLGAILRFYISKLNHNSFPFGTLICNCFAVWIAELFIISTFQFRELNIVLKGFCGSLSTVSTWIKEICTLEEIELRFIYFWISLFLSLYIGLLIS